METKALKERSWVLRPTVTGERARGDRGGFSAEGIWELTSVTVIGGDQETEGDQETIWVEHPSGEKARAKAWL